VSRNKFWVDTNFIFFGRTDQKLWMFEVFRRSLVRAGMRWSQPARVDHTCKKRRAGRRIFFLHMLRLGHSPAAMSSYQTDNLQIFWFFFFGLMRKFGDGPGILGEWVYSTPIFWRLPLHLGVCNLPFLMELGDFILLDFFAKIRVNLDLHIHRWNLVLWKSAITKNSSRIASIMEIFCTLL
jgi:hypothetical protein